VSGCEYIIIQAGGKGTRLKGLTKNKPKALVPINNAPMIFHLFRKYPDKQFIVIGDYKKDVLESYLDTFADVKYIVVGTDGCDGTCSGIQNALKTIPENHSFMFIWSDLILSEDFELPDCSENQIGLSCTFPCRWKYENHIFSEEKTDKFGVAGLFIFKNKETIGDVPESGEFVRWLQSKNMTFEPISLKSTKEFGLLEEIGTIDSGKCRPFNSMTILDGKIKKEGIDEQGLKLAAKEKAWYRYVSKYEDVRIPKIYSLEPLVMEMINGKNVFEYNFSEEDKKMILRRIVEQIDSLHKHDEMPPNVFSLDNAYCRKTMERLNKVRNLIPKNNEKYIMINGKKCRNVFFFQKEFKEKIKSLSCKHFNLIHGDCTFSNIILRNGSEPIFIDPRGYFGFTELFGDPNYDWAKLYYSVVGNYDQFNHRRFNLDKDEEIKLKIESNGWESIEGEFFRLLGSGVSPDQIKLIHAIIWLSLTTYAWEDYDSVCGAFYNGLYYLEDVL
jgi:tRNA A-37 threonylcarbamoyl transferase component Bud32/GTP:adenosylcobinamide-phosphate guanylyltransferase